MDEQTEQLVAVLADRDILRRRLAISDRQVRDALDEWAKSRPGHRKGVATEAGARFMLTQMGVL